MPQDPIAPCPPGRAGHAGCPPRESPICEVCSAHPLKLRNTTTKPETGTATELPRGRRGNCAAAVAGQPAPRRAAGEVAAAAGGVPQPWRN